MTTATKDIETINVDVDEARAISTEQIKRAGSIIVMCIIAILAKAPMPNFIERLQLSWAPWSCA